MPRILFVCLGNICRSPSAEGVMAQKIQRAGLEEQIQVDSAGTAGYHIGELADPRTRKAAQNRGIPLTHRARKFTAPKDFETFDHIIVMDDSNLEDVLEQDPENQYAHKVSKMTDYRIEGTHDHVPDPYYGGPEAFEEVLDILEDACQGLLQTLTETQK